MKTTVKITEHIQIVPAYERDGYDILEGNKK